MKEVLRGLQEHIDAATPVMFHRHKRVGESIDGIPLAFTKKWITLRGFVDFRPDGYRIIPVSTVKKIKRDSNCKLVKTILEAEGVLPDERDPMAMPAFKNAKSILRYARDNDILITAEIESVEKGSWLAIGKITAYDKDSLTMDWIDTEAVWRCGDDNRQICIRDVTQFVFDLEYANLFAKYATRA